MKHVNERAARRPAAPAGGLGGARGGGRARRPPRTPTERYPTCATMIDDLESALEVEVARGGGATGGEATNVLDAVPPPQPPHPDPAPGLVGGGHRSSSPRPAAAVAIAALISARKAALARQGNPGGTKPIAVAVGDRLRPRRRRRRARRARSGSRSTATRPDRLDHRELRRPPTSTARTGRRPLRRRRQARHADRARASGPRPRAGTPRSTRAASGPPEDLAGWGTAIGHGGRRVTKRRDRAARPPPSRLRYYLLWFTTPAQTERRLRRRDRRRQAARLGRPPRTRSRRSRLVALDREPDQPVAELGVGDPGRLEELREDAGLGEAGDRVDLVDQHLAVRRRRRSRSGRGRCSRRARKTLDGQLAHPLASSRRRSAPARPGPCPPSARTWPRSRTSRRGRRSRPAARSPARRCRAPSTRPPCPPAYASTITRGSWRSAGSTASSSSRSGRSTLLIPTLEPSRDGLTQSGRPERQRPLAPAVLAGLRRSRPAGSPWKANRRFRVSLSMQTAEARTSGPT